MTERDDKAQVSFSTWSDALLLLLDRDDLEFDAAQFRSEYDAGRTPDEVVASLAAEAALGFADAKWVRIMADFAADPVWERSGCNANLDALPVSAALRQDLAAWQDWYERDCKDYLDDQPFLARVEFTAKGLELARRVKAELPDWTVVYHDEVKAEAYARRELFEYEVEASPFERRHGYDPTEARIAAFFAAKGIGGGADPAAALMASHDTAIAERNALARALDEREQTTIDSAVEFYLGGVRFSPGRYALTRLDPAPETDESPF